MFPRAIPKFKQVLKKQKKETVSCVLQFRREIKLREKKIPLFQASASDGDAKNRAGLLGAAPVVSANPFAAALSSSGGSDPLWNRGTCLLVIAAGKALGAVHGADALLDGFVDLLDRTDIQAVVIG